MIEKKLRQKILAYIKGWKLTAQQMFWGLSNGYPLQCSCLEDPMDRRAWWGTVQGVTKSRRRLSV